MGLCEGTSLNLILSNQHTISWSLTYLDTASLGQGISIYLRREHTEVLERVGNFWILLEGIKSISSCRMSVYGVQLLQHSQSHLVVKVLLQIFVFSLFHCNLPDSAPEDWRNHQKSTRLVRGELNQEGQKSGGRILY